MITIPNQSSVSKAFQEFDEAGRVRLSSFCDGVGDVMEELVKFTLINRGVSGYLTSRYSERKEADAKLDERVGLWSI
jgi:arsenic resistance protein ArsH